MKRTRSMGQRLLATVAPALGAGWLRLTRLTMRLTWSGTDTALPGDGGPVIYCFWHSQLAMMPWVQRRPPSVVPISRSRDGEVTARLFGYLEVESVRGSSSRGGPVALRGMIRAAKAGKDLAITPDGPRGPRKVIQPGAVWLAQATGRPLLPVAFACRPAITLKSWDRMIIPVPFGKGVFVYGEHQWIPAGCDLEGRQEAGRELAKRLETVARRAADLLVT